MKNRNSSIDFFRAVMMLGIILLHTLVEVGHWNTYWHLGNLLLSCVCGFVLISGYYSIRFSYWKVVKLYGVAIWCIGLIAVVFRPEGRNVVRIFKNYWFLHSYVFLMCFAPLVNCLFPFAENRRERLCVLIPILMVVFGWGTLLNLSVVHHIVPPMPGLVAKSGLTLVGIYIAGRLYKEFESWFDEMPVWVYLISLPALAAVSTMGLGWFSPYNSPVSVMIALCLFHLVKQIRLPEAIGRAMIFLAPSVLGIYILHANEVVYEKMRTLYGLIDPVVEIGWASDVFIMLLVFTAALLVDLLRRCMLMGFYKVLARCG